MFAISSEHIVFNEYGDIKLVSPITSPIPLSDVKYQCNNYIKIAP